MRSITDTGWHPVPKFHGDRRLNAAAGSAFSKGATASAPTCGLTAGHMGVNKKHDRVMKMAY